MEKVPSIYDMDLKDWELLPDDGDLSRGVVVDMDYFLCPSPPRRDEAPFGRRESKGETEEVAKETEESTVVAPKAKAIDMEQEAIASLLHGKEAGKGAKGSPVASAEVAEKEQDAISLVMHEKSKANEFANMKVAAERFQFDGEQIPREAMDDDDDEEEEEEEEEDCDTKRKESWEGFGLGSLLGWRLAGIGALCSIGVAAAAISILLLGGDNCHRQQQVEHQIRSLRFPHLQIHNGDKGLKHVVQQAARLNRALSAVRGVPAAGTNISFGGCYEAFGN